MNLRTLTEQELVALRCDRRYTAAQRSDADRELIRRADLARIITSRAIRASNNPQSVDPILRAFYALYLRNLASRTTCVVRASDLRQLATALENAPLS